MACRAVCDVEIKKQKGRVPSRPTHSFQTGQADGARAKKHNMQKQKGAENKEAQRSRRGDGPRGVGLERGLRMVMVVSFRRGVCVIALGRHGANVAQAAHEGVDGAR